MSPSPRSIPQIRSDDSVACVGLAAATTPPIEFDKVVCAEGDSDCDAMQVVSLIDCDHKTEYSSQQDERAESSQDDDDDDDDDGATTPIPCVEESEEAAFSHNDDNTCQEDEHHLNGTAEHEPLSIEGQHSSGALPELVDLLYCSNDFYNKEVKNSPDGAIYDVDSVTSHDVGRGTPSFHTQQNDGKTFILPRDEYHPTDEELIAFSRKLGEQSKKPVGRPRKGKPQRVGNRSHISKKEGRKTSPKKNLSTSKKNRSKTLSLSPYTHLRASTEEYMALRVEREEAKQQELEDIVEETEKLERAKRLQSIEVERQRQELANQQQQKLMLQQEIQHLQMEAREHEHRMLLRRQEEISGGMPPSSIPMSYQQQQLRHHQFQHQMHHQHQQHQRMQFLLAQQRAFFQRQLQGCGPGPLMGGGPILPHSIPMFGVPPGVPYGMPPFYSGPTVPLSPGATLPGSPPLNHGGKLYPASSSDSEDKKPVSVDDSLRKDELQDEVEIVQKTEKQIPTDKGDDAEITQKIELKMKRYYTNTSRCYQNTELDDEDQVLAERMIAANPASFRPETLVDVQRSREEKIAKAADAMANILQNRRTKRSKEGKNKFSKKYKMRSEHKGGNVSPAFGSEIFAPPWFRNPANGQLCMEQKKKGSYTKIADRFPYGQRAVMPTTPVIRKVMTKQIESASSSDKECTARACDNLKEEPPSSTAPKTGVDSPTTDHESPPSPEGGAESLSTNAKLLSAQETPTVNLERLSSLEVGAVTPKVDHDCSSFPKACADTTILSNERSSTSKGGTEITTANRGPSSSPQTGTITPEVQHGCSSFPKACTDAPTAKHERLSFPKVGTDTPKMIHPSLLILGTDAPATDDERPSSPSLNTDTDDMVETSQHTGSCKKQSTPEEKIGRDATMHICKIDRSQAARDENKMATHRFRDSTDEEENDLDAAITPNIEPMSRKPSDCTSPPNGTIEQQHKISDDFPIVTPPFGDKLVLKEKMKGEIRATDPSMSVTESVVELTQNTTSNFAMAMKAIESDPASKSPTKSMCSGPTSLFAPLMSQPAIVARTLHREAGQSSPEFAMPSNDHPAPLRWQLDELGEYNRLDSIPCIKSKRSKRVTGENKLNGGTQPKAKARTAKMKYHGQQYEGAILNSRQHMPELEIPMDGLDSMLHHWQGTNRRATIEEEMNIDNEMNNSVGGSEEPEQDQSLENIFHKMETSAPRYPRTPAKPSSPNRFDEDAALTKELKTKPTPEYDSPQQCVLPPELDAILRRMEQSCRNANEVSDSIPDSPTGRDANDSTEDDNISQFFSTPTTPDSIQYCGAEGMYLDATTPVLVDLDGKKLVTCKVPSLTPKKNLVKEECILSNKKTGAQSQDHGGPPSPFAFGNGFAFPEFTPLLEPEKNGKPYSPTFTSNNSLASSDGGKANGMADIAGHTIPSNHQKVGNRTVSVPASGTKVSDEASGEASKPKKRTKTKKEPTAKQNAKWMFYYRLLIAYKEENNGSTDVPRQYENKKLGCWVKHQRDKHRLGSIPHDRVRMLDEIGFNWKVRTQWNDMFERLVEYQKKFGDTRVVQKKEELLAPTYGKKKRLKKRRDYEEDASLPPLRFWVFRQRYLYKYGKLPEKRIRKLESIGFQWDGNKRDQREQELFEKQLNAQQTLKLVQARIDEERLKKTRKIPPAAAKVGTKEVRIEDKGNAAEASDSKQEDGHSEPNNGTEDKKANPALPLEKSIEEDNLPIQMAAV